MGEVACDPMNSHSEQNVVPHRASLAFVPESTVTLLPTEVLKALVYQAQNSV